MPLAKKGKFYSELRKKFFWFMEVLDRELTEEEMLLPEPSLVKRNDDYMRGYSELYILSNEQFLHRKTEESGESVWILIGIELVYNDYDYVHREYIYKLQAYENDFLMFIDLLSYYNIYKD